MARFAEEQPSLTRTGLLPDEQVTLEAHAWVSWSDLTSLPDRVEPPQLLDALRALVPEGPRSAGDPG